MKQIRMLLIGLIAGTLLATAGTGFATDAIQKVTASIRTDYTVTIDGKEAELKNAPLAYKGSSYLPVKELAEMFGKDVDFKDGEIQLITPKEEKNMIEITALDLSKWTSLNKLESDGYDVRMGVGLVPGETSTSKNRLATITIYSDLKVRNTVDFIIPSSLVYETIFTNEDNLKLLFKDGEFFLENTFLEEFLVQ